MIRVFRRRRIHCKGKFECRISNIYTGEVRCLRVGKGREFRKGREKS